jgi:protein tyrosine/serine phosphatase
LSLENVSKSFYNTANEFYKKQIIIFNYARPTELDQLKITGTPELITVDFATMFNESYIDPAEEMKQQPVALSI